MSSGASNACMHDLSTRFFMPPWWVRAYYQAALSGQQTSGAAKNIGAKIFPSLNDYQLNALATVISSFQKQVLSNKDVNSLTVRVSSHEYRKHLTNSHRHKLAAYDQMLQVLPSLRFMAEKNGGFEPLPMFTKERWLKTNGNQEYLDLELELAGECAVELLLGFTVSHLEMLRRAEQRTEVLPLLGNCPPINLWRSAWQELNANEQLLLLRLEESMQWDCAWMHFDGIFGKPLAEISRGISLGAARGTAKDDRQLQKIMTFLEKLGKRLCQHGLLKFDIDDEYLALSSKESFEALLVWQVSPQKLQMTEVDSYKDTALRYVLDQTLTPQITRLLHFLVADSAYSTEQFEEISRSWIEFVSSDREDLCESASTGTSSGPVLALPLFFEWHLRQQPRHLFPLQDEIKGMEIAKLTRAGLDIDVEQRYRKFVYLLRESGDVRRAFESQPTMTLSDPRASCDPNFRKYLATYCQSRKSVEFNGGETVSTVRIGAVSTAGWEKKSEQMDGRKVDAITSSSDANLRKIALGELQKMMDHDRKGFENLKANYLNSLETQKRKLLAELSQRMRPEQFENHLRHSLVKYMIDNPTVWTSAKTEGPTKKLVAMI